MLHYSETEIGNVPSAQLRSTLLTMQADGAALHCLSVCHPIRSSSSSVGSAAPPGHLERRTRGVYTRHSSHAGARLRPGVQGIGGCSRIWRSQTAPCFGELTARSAPSPKVYFVEGNYVTLPVTGRPYNGSYRTQAPNLRDASSHQDTPMGKGFCASTI